MAAPTAAEKAHTEAAAAAAEQVTKAIKDGNLEEAERWQLLSNQQHQMAQQEASS